MTATIMAGTALFCTAITAVFSILAYAKVVGMEKSTHQIQYMPVQQPGGPTLDEGIGMTNENATQMMNKLYPNYED